MKKTLLAVALLGLALSAPAYADDMMKCDDASMMKVDAAMKADTGMKEHVDMAMKEMDMAKTSMKDGKMDDCAMHLDNAMKQVMMK